MPPLEPSPRPSTPPDSPSAARKVAPASAATDITLVDHLVAGGWMPLPQYLGYRAHLPTPDRELAQTTNRWREMQDAVSVLTATEYGRADGQAVVPLVGAPAVRAVELENDERFQRSYGLLPARFGLVELDRLILHQYEVDLEHAARIDTAIGDQQSATQILDLCLPLHSDHPEARGRAIGPNAWAWTSTSNDLRPLEPVVLEPSNIVGYAAPGDVVSLCGFTVGFSSNLLSVIEVNSRLILNNGHHRAFALLRAGRSHAPCLIQTLTRREDVALLAPEVQQRMDLYGSSPRPPLLVDFFNDAVCQTLALPRRRREVRVSLSVEAADIPA